MYKMQRIPTTVIITLSLALSSFSHALAAQPIEAEIEHSAASDLTHGLMVLAIVTGLVVFSRLKRKHKWH
ncbi:hypothetical protein [Agaribacterium sp. ZY112]|uniref:hypothetical protein n=1 Tax=Agaribacterium sp. ZY112 TaxID=3233574 RepID=UPI003526302F